MGEEGVDDEEGGEEEVGGVGGGGLEVGAEPGGHFFEIILLEEREGRGEEGVDEEVEANDSWRTEKRSGKE